MIWIIGNKGMLGQDVSHYCNKVGLPYIGSDSEVSILSPATLREFVERNSPSWIVNCSGYTAVDKAETEKELAYALNRDGVLNISTIAKQFDIPLIHMSTDYVFDGDSETPLSESSTTCPVSIYGKSKLAGEEAIRDIVESHFIIRTAWLYGEYGPNFVSTMLKLMNERDSIKVVHDQHGSPTWTVELVKLIMKIIMSESQSYGTYHFSGEGHCTWYDFANMIYQFGRELGILHSHCKVMPCSSDEYPTAAQRPKYSLMSKKKVKEVFSLDIPNWKISLKSYMQSNGVN